MLAGAMRSAVALAMAVLCTIAAADTPTPAQYDIAPAPAWVDTLPIPPLAEGHADDRVILLHDTQLSLLDTEPHWYYHRASAVRGGSAVTAAAEMRVGFDPAFARPTLHGAWVIRDGERIDRLASARIDTLRREQGLDDNLLDGQLTLHVVLDDVRVGDIVEYAVSVRGDNPVHAGHHAASHDFALGLPIERQRLRMLRPAARAVVQRLVGDGLEHTVDERDGVIDERWQRTAVPALRGEEQVPPWFVDGPLVELSTMRGWDEVVAWALPLYAGAAAPEIATLASDLGLRRGHADEAAVLKAIAFVQDEIRYTGLELGAHAYTPYPPAEVLRRRYGDCKDKTQLLTGLLRHLGLRADPALVDTGLREHLADQLPSPRVFDHVIVRFEFEGETYWIDATAARQGGDLAHRVQADFGRALLVAPGEAALREMPVPPNDEPSTDIEETIDLRDGEGGLADSADYRIRTVYRGANADHVRGDFARRSARDIGEGYAGWIGNYYPGIEMLSPPTTEDDNPNNTFTVHEHYRIDDAWEAADGGGSEVSVWLTEIDRVATEPKAGKRRAPWSLGAPRNLRQRLVVHLDEGWEEVAEPAMLRTPHLDYRASTANDGRTLRLEGHLRTLVRSVPADELARFRRDIDDIEGRVGYTLTRSGGGPLKTIRDPSVAGSALQLADWIDWRLLPLLFALGLLWAWVAACGVSRSVSLRWGVLFRPRATVRAGMAVWRPRTVVAVLFAAGLVSVLIDDAVPRFQAQRGVLVTALGVLAGTALSVAIYWIVCVVYAWLGRRLGGRGRTRDVVTALAWSQLPVAAVLPLILLLMALYGADVFHGAADAWVAMLLGMVAGVLPMMLWSFLVWFPALAEAHRFSLRRAVLVSVLPGFALVLAFMLGIGVVALVRG